MPYVQYGWVASRHVGPQRLEGQGGDRAAGQVPGPGHRRDPHRAGPGQRESRRRRCPGPRHDQLLQVGPVHPCLDLRLEPVRQVEVRGPAGTAGPTDSPVRRAYAARTRRRRPVSGAPGARCRSNACAGRRCGPRTGPACHPQAQTASADAANSPASAACGPWGAWCHRGIPTPIRGRTRPVSPVAGVGAGHPTARCETATRGSTGAADGRGTRRTRRCPPGGAARRRRTPRSRAGGPDQLQGPVADRVDQAGGGVRHVPGPHDEQVGAGVLQGVHGRPGRPRTGRTANGAPCRACSSRRAGDQPRGPGSPVDQLHVSPRRGHRDRGARTGRRRPRTRNIPAPAGPRLVGRGLDRGPGRRGRTRGPGAGPHVQVLPARTRPAPSRTGPCVARPRRRGGAEAGVRVPPDPFVVGVVVLARRPTRTRHTRAGGRGRRPGTGAGSRRRRCRRSRPGSAGDAGAVVNVGRMVRSSCSPRAVPCSCASSTIDQVQGVGAQRAGLRRKRLQVGRRPRVTRSVPADRRVRTRAARGPSASSRNRSPIRSVVTWPVCAA